MLGGSGSAASRRSSSSRDRSIGDSCHGNRYAGFAFSDLQAYFTDHLVQFLTGAPEDQVPIFQFNVPEALDSAFFEGVAMSNYVLAGWNPTTLPDTRQSFVLTSTSPQSNAFFGHSRLLQHEVGHHLGFHHPFNGYRRLTETCGDGEFIIFGAPATCTDSRPSIRRDHGLRDVKNDYSRLQLDNLRAGRPAIPRIVRISSSVRSLVCRGRFSGRSGAAVRREGGARARGLSVDDYEPRWKRHVPRNQGVVGGRTRLTSAWRERRTRERGGTADINQLLPEGEDAMSGAIQPRASRPRRRIRQAGRHQSPRGWLTDARPGCGTVAARPSRTSARPR